MADRYFGWRFPAALLAIFFIATPTTVAKENQSPTLAAIKSAGVIRVGVKTDVEPFGSVNASGEIVGFEIELAKDIALRLGVQIVKVPVSTETRFQKLQLGEVDLLLATVGDSLMRRRIATAIEPGYFESGVTVMLRPNQKFNDWTALRGTTLCALQGAYFNRPISERYLVNLQSFKTVRDALLAFSSGRCDGFLYNAPAVKNILNKADFQGYSAPLPEVLATPWAMFIRLDEGGGEFEKFLGDAAADWYRNGMITKTAAIWGVSSSSWPTDEIKLWTNTEPDGKYTCARNGSGQWPAECRRVEFVKSDEATGLRSIGLALKEFSGADFSYIYDAYDRGRIAKGLAYTMALTALSILATILLGVVAALVSEARILILSRTVNALMSFGRLVPPLLMMYLVYFGVGNVLLSLYAVELPALFVAVICLAYYSAAIVMNALHEAAVLIRKSAPDFLLTKTNLSQALDYARWPIKQALINVSKMSMIASAIAIPELLSQINLIMAERGNLIVMMTSLLVGYYLITSFWVRAFTLLERRIYPVVSKP